LGEGEGEDEDEDEANGRLYAWHGEDVCLPGSEQPLRRHHRQFVRRQAGGKMFS
jgi:hypothetical protein